MLPQSNERTADHILDTLAHYDAFQIAIAHGDNVRAQVFVERAYAARMIAKGDESPVTTKLKRLTEQSTEYLSNGENPVHSVASATRKDGEGFENWLWLRSEW